MVHRSQNPVGCGEQEYFNEKRPVNLRVGVSRLSELVLPLHRHGRSSSITGTGSKCPHVVHFKCLEVYLRKSLPRSALRAHQKRASRNTSKENKPWPNRIQPIRCSSQARNPRVGRRTCPGRSPCPA